MLFQRVGERGTFLELLYTVGYEYLSRRVLQKSMDYLGWWAYLPWVRSTVVQAQYVKAPGALQARCCFFSPTPSPQVSISCPAALFNVTESQCAMDTVSSCQLVILVQPYVV